MRQLHSVAAAGGQGSDDLIRILNQTGQAKGVGNLGDDVADAAKGAKGADATAAAKGGGAKADVSDAAELDVDTLATRLKAHGVRGDIDSVVARAKGTGPDAVAARGELRAVERARQRGYDAEILTPPKGPGAPQGRKTPEARLTRGADERVLEAKSATSAPDRATWNAHADKANKQIKESGKQGEISFDWTEVDVASAADFRTAAGIENFLNGKMTGARLREVRYFEIVWKAPNGRTQITSRTRDIDGKVSSVRTKEV
jgi:hypothetical protein